MQSGGRTNNLDCNRDRLRFMIRRVTQRPLLLQGAIDSIEKPFFLGQLGLRFVNS